MFEKILGSIQQTARFSENEQTLFVSKLKTRTFQKNNCLLKVGQVCSVIYYVRKGALRLYHMTENGDELTLNLFSDNDWVIDFDSFMAQKPAKNTLVAFQETEVFEISIVNIHELVAVSQIFLFLGKIFKEGLKDSMYDMLITPEEKYIYLLNHKPLLLQTFPMKYIASYLKMTPETLSRVRRKINH